MERKGVDIGEVTLEAIVAGRGPVTVVFENGLATPLEEWDTVVSAVAARARSLRYDRRRAPARGPLAPRTAGDMATDLKRLLEALAIGPPYVLVGHSWGGVVARVFAHRHPAEVTGLVFVDATHEVIESKGLALLPVMYGVMSLAARIGPGRRWLLRLLCPVRSSPAYRARLEQRLNDPALWAGNIRTARAEAGGIRQSLAALRHDCPDLPFIPTHVLTAGGMTGPNVKGVRRVHDAWKAAVAKTPGARYTNIPASSHYLPIDEPTFVIDAITGLIEGLQTNHQPGGPLSSAHA